MATTTKARQAEIETERAALSDELTAVSGEVAVLRDQLDPLLNRQTEILVKLHARPHELSTRKLSRLTGTMTFQNVARILAQYRRRR